MDKNIVQRIKVLMQNENLTNASLTRALGYDSQEKIARLFRDENNYPSFQIIFDISNKFVYYSMDWLINGTGPMLKKTQNNYNLDEKIHSNMVSEPIIGVYGIDPKIELMRDIKEISTRVAKIADFVFSHDISKTKSP